MKNAIQALGGSHGAIAKYRAGAGIKFSSRTIFCVRPSSHLLFFLGGMLPKPQPCALQVFSHVSGIFLLFDNQLQGMKVLSSKNTGLRMFFGKEPRQLATPVSAKDIGSSISLQSNAPARTPKHKYPLNQGIFWSVVPVLLPASACRLAKASIASIWGAAPALMESASVTRTWLDNLLRISCSSASFTLSNGIN